MSVDHVVLPSLAVVLAWISVAAVLVGCGFLTRRGLLRLLADSPADGLRVADLWLGLAALIAYLQLWSLALPLSWETWPAPVCAGLAGLAVGGRGLRVRRGRAVSLSVIALAALGTLWLANQALGAALDYDLGLYHLNVIEYTSRYAAIPGLANLHPRLGAGDAHLVFVAFLSHGLWGRAATHLANGLLVSMLFLEIASRFVLRGGTSSFTRRLALLFAPATVAVAGIGLGYRLASPNLDLATFVLVAVGALYLAECVENGFVPAAALTATAAFAVAASTRPLYWAATLIAAGLLVLAARRASPGRSLRPFALVCILPAALALGWMARQAILSGYPFFPLTVGGLPVDWRVPTSLVHDQMRSIDAWARWPGKTPDQVFGSWHWLRHWLHVRGRDLDVILPLVLLASLVPSLSVRDERRARRLRPMLAVLVPAVVSLVAWFFTAPDPRFALGPIWLVPIALAAWALPALDARPHFVAVAAAAVSVGFAWIGLHAVVWLFLAVFDAWAFATLALRLFGPRNAQRLVPHVALISLALTPAAILADRGSFDVIDANQSGALGTPPVPVATVASFTTSSGLQLSQPAGGDQCWQAILCTPQPETHLRLRGAGVGDGFALGR